jgi:hypothetical protein
MTHGNHEHSGSGNNNSTTNVKSKSNKSNTKSTDGENSKHDSDNNSQSRSNAGRRKPRANNNRSTTKTGQNNQPNHKPRNAINDGDEAYSKTSSVISEAEPKANIDINCFICTEPIKIFAVGECEHRICHVCSLRLRALYKNNHCAYCKVRYD